MKRLFKNDGTLLFGYWIHTRFDAVPEEYHRWACENVPYYDLQLVRLKRGLEPIPGLSDGTTVLPVAKPPERKVFTSRAVRPQNFSTPVMNENTTITTLRHCIADGMSISRIAQVMQINRNKVRKMIDEHHLPEPRDGRKDNFVPMEARLKGAKAQKTRKKPHKPWHPSHIQWTNEFFDAVTRMRQAGESWKNIARKLSFKEGGHVLCTRYHARARQMRINAEKADPLPTPAPKSWWKRLVLWLAGKS